MVRRTLRKTAVTVMAVGCFLSAAATARALQRPDDAPAATTATATTALTEATTLTATSAAANPCPTAPPVPNIAPGEPDPDLLWPAQKLGLSQAGVWYLDRGAHVTVAVIDTGVDPANPAFAKDAVLPGPSVVDPGASADYDCDGHGTAVAAIIAGQERGLFGFTGVAPEAQILPIRISPDASKPGSSVQLANAIRTATDAGARIVNISMGVPDDSPELRSAVQNALASDVLIVAAVGPWAKSYPAAIPGVLAVGAVNADGSAVADGQGTGALVAGPGGRMAVPAVGYTDGLTTMQGTGLAAPYVSGVAALVMSYRPTLDNWQIAKRLEDTADQPVANPTAVASTLNAPNPATGYGVVDPYRAVTQDLPAERHPDPSVGPQIIVSPAAAAVPGHDRDASRIALGVSAAAVLALAAPVAVAARRGRVKGSRAGV